MWGRPRTDFAGINIFFSTFVHKSDSVYPAESFQQACSKKTPFHSWMFLFSHRDNNSMVQPQSNVVLSPPICHVHVTHDVMSLSQLL